MPSWPLRADPPDGCVFGMPGRIEHQQRQQGCHILHSVQFWNVFERELGNMYQMLRWKSKPKWPIIMLCLQTRHLLWKFRSKQVCDIHHPISFHDRGLFADSLSPNFPRCESCAAGKAVAFKGATACVQCLPGTFQSGSGAVECEDCPKSHFAPNTSSFGCQSCPLGKDAARGAATCGLATVGNFLDPVNSFATTECPHGSECDGGLQMPRPRKGFWVDRSNVKFVSSIHRCSRLSCIGADDDYGGGDNGMLQLDSCWSLSAFNDSLSKALEANRDDGRCDSDKLLCSEGSTGPRKQPTVFCPRAFHDIFFLWRLLILNRLFHSLVLFVLRVV